MFVAFDADARTNKDVATQLVKCVHHLHASGFRVLLEVWPGEFGKGIDDAIQNGHMARIRTLDRDEWPAEVERIAVPLVGQLRFEELLDEVGRRSRKHNQKRSRNKKNSESTTRPMSVS